MHEAIATCCCSCSCVGYYQLTIKCACLTIYTMCIYMRWYFTMHFFLSCKELLAPLLIVHHVSIRRAATIGYIFIQTTNPVFQTSLHTHIKLFHLLVPTQMIEFTGDITWRLTPLVGISALQPANNFQKERRTLCDRFSTRHLTTDLCTDSCLPHNKRMTTHKINRHCRLWSRVI